MNEILANIYKIEIPLPKNPLKALNSYIVKSAERNLIVDTGWNQDECMNAIRGGVKELEVDLKKTDFFITHLHADHLGLVSNLTTNKSKIYFNQPDADRFNADFLWEDFSNFARMNGFPENELQEVPNKHPGFKFRSKERLTFHILKQDDTIKIGNYLFKCVETPGHTKGHMCLYEPHKKIFIAGDHILDDITPTIQSAILELRIQKSRWARQRRLLTNRLKQFKLKLDT